MEIADLVSRSTVAIRSTASSKRQLMHLLADLAAPSLGVEPVVLFEGLMEREALGSTGLSGGAAAPHARSPLIPRVAGAFIKLDQPIAFDSVDGRPVDLVFGLFAPAEAGAEHLRALAAVSRLLRRDEVRQRLRHARSVDSLYSLLAQQIEADAA